MCIRDSVETVKEIASSISKLIEDEKKENVPFLTSTLIAYLKSMEDVLKKEKILQDSLNKKLFYEKLKPNSNKINFDKKLYEKLSSKKNPNYIKAINIINKYFTN